MDNGSLRKLADSVRRAPDPVRRGREVLLEEYRKTGGVGETEVKRSAAFEIIRSIIVQAAYETMGPDSSWLSIADLGPEMDEASRACGEHLKNGLASSILRAFPSDIGSAENNLRRALELEAICPKRFLGSTRMHMPGVGYAVSVRKRYAENQDSFRLCSFNNRKAILFADGCGSARFASLASHLAVLEAFGVSANGIDRRSICGINEKVAALLNSDSIRSLGEPGMDSGVSTLLIGISENGRSKVFKVGDSIPFIVWNDAEGDVLEALADTYEMRTVIGRAGSLAESEIEEHERETGRLVFTSDGVTNFLADASSEINRWTMLSHDPVIISERLMRSVLRSQLAWGFADDATIIVEDNSC
ncbi:MAG: protein phosphatase 2C domain-containing protein [Candidatus Micrarchaeota archaeon]